MDFVRQLRALAERIPNQTARIGSQAATSQSLVMPFIQAMGYSPFDPAETVPQFNVDLGGGKTETVDYALVQEDVPIILIDVKKWDTKLSDLHTSRLYRCFPVADARFAILTNGIDFRFYSDVGEPNRMDRKPYFTFSVSALGDGVCNVLRPFTKDAFDYDTLLDDAERLTKGAGAVGRSVGSRGGAAEPAAHGQAGALDAGPSRPTADYSEQVTLARMKQSVEESKEARSASDEQAPSKARVRRPNERAPAAGATDEDMKQTVLQMEAIDPAKLKESIDAAKAASRSPRRILEPTTDRGLSSAQELVREATERKQKQLKAGVLSRLAAAVRGEATQDQPSRSGNTVAEQPAAAAGGKGAAKSGKKKPRRKRGSFSETQWFLEGVKSDAEVLEAGSSDDKYARRDDLSEEERRKYSLRDKPEDS